MAGWPGMLRLGEVLMKGLKAEKSCEGEWEGSVMVGLGLSIGDGMGDVPPRRLRRAAWAIVNLAGDGWSVSRGVRSWRWRCHQYGAHLCERG